MATPRKRVIIRRKRKTEDFELYDFAPQSEQLKNILIYKGRKMGKGDPGVYRMQSVKGSSVDPLCILWRGGMLMGGALEEAKMICPPPPEGLGVPSRFIKSSKETSDENYVD